MMRLLEHKYLGARALGKYLFLGVFIIKSSENNFFIIITSLRLLMQQLVSVCVLADKILMFDAGLLFELH